MEVSRAANALKNTVRTVEADIADILQSGNFYCTEEIARELTSIKNGLDHLRLDGTLLGSEEWKGTFDPQSTSGALAGATGVLDKAAARLFDYKSQLGAVSMGQKQENEVRELHQWAITSLKQIQQDLEPFTYGATDRIKQFGDHIGVTDRYTGYRHNLTRGSRDPFKMETSWMDKGRTTGFMNPLSRSNTTLGIPGRETQGRPQLEGTQWGSVAPDNLGSLRKEVRFSNDRAPMVVNKGYRTLDTLYSRSNTFTAPGTRAGAAPNFSEHMHTMRTLNGMNATLASRPGERNQEMMTTTARGPRAMSVQEQAGINTTFPGRTEYMQRYASPADITRCSDFLINPKPNMQIHGRPLGKACYQPSFTEYQTRFDWPDGEKIVKLPWLRK
ncbi:uncharacterized protein LOC143282679 [Babylonia areolata]|uniref:uncharacterized protein LOC143282679 n=1 Tax=Babylonia areolata TaxID=304850 RepID=UPI003FD11319